MLKTFRVLSLLLDYPDEALLTSLEAIPGIVKAEGILSEREQVTLSDFLATVPQRDDLRGWQASYSGLFDTSTHENLYLFDFVYGESRDRGQAMVDLKESYQKTGLTLGADELPDYLPVFLEFAALQPTVNDALRLMKEVKPVLEVMQQKFEFRSHPYAPLIAICHALASREVKDDANV